MAVRVGRAEDPVATTGVPADGAADKVVAVPVGAVRGAVAARRTIPSSAVATSEGAAGASEAARGA